jgi:maltose O-acetyltransferase
VLFYSDGMSIEEVKKLLKDMIPQKQRWLGTNHPDSKIRREAFCASGVKIGEEVFISIGMVILDDYKPLVSIGDRVAFGNYVSLVAASAPNNSLLNKLSGINRYIKYEPIIIENDVWVGSGAIILPGVTVGEKSIIGAGAVVNRNIQPYSVAAGVPAKVIKTLEKK